MSANGEQYTFIDIFTKSIPMGRDKESVTVNRISIPKIQRDYAQGRKTPEINRVRKNFLEALYQAVEGAPITLDFVYGNIDEKGVLTPLDGQQRLTTLFLLHWYAAKRAGLSEEKYAFLGKFGYETRYSARDFCMQLLSFNPEFGGKLLSEEITNQPWFPYDWIKDPTVSAMLVMLDAIQDRFASISNLWEKLENRAICFHFLPISNMGLTDELYIMMNSRGKPLTQFEHFKAELEATLDMFDHSGAKRIAKKIDGAWQDILWKHRGEADATTDDAFLNYFRFVCDVICYEAGDTPHSRPSDELDMLHYHFGEKASKRADNIKTLESYFDCWEANDSAKLANQFVSHKHEPSKIMLDGKGSADLFAECLRSYVKDRKQRSQKFPMTSFILLYALVTYLLHKDSPTPITADQFARRLRIVHNLSRNSSSEFRGSENESNNRIPAILRQTKKLVVEGTIELETEEKGFNKNQLIEEVAKEDWLKSNSSWQEKLFTLEDHDLLRGQISVVGLDNPSHFDRFSSLFECDKDAIDCALMACGFYAQEDANRKRYQFASSNTAITRFIDESWRSLFHKSGQSKGFERTKAALNALLEKGAVFNKALLTSIKDKYLDDCESSRTYTFRYYYIKYDCFRPGCYGKYSTYYGDNEYEWSVMCTGDRVSSTTYRPFLKALEETIGAEVSGNYNGQRIELDGMYLYSTKNSYELRSDEDDSVLKAWEIEQKEGVDEIDRIEFIKGKNPPLQCMAQSSSPQLSDLGFTL